MAQQERQPHRSLSDISHLFLSSVREKQTGTSARPVRKPPKRIPSVDLTPEEFKHVLGVESEAASPEAKPCAEVDAGAEDEVGRVPPVKAIIAAHLGEGQVDAAKRYGRNLAAGNRRAGLIVIDAG